FVAKNEQFKTLCTNLCKLAIEKNYTEPNTEMQDMVNGLIATINENMKVKKVSLMDIADNEFVMGYDHADGNICVLVKFAAANTDVFKTDAFKTFAFNTAMHVCAASPMYLCDADVPKEYEEKQLEIFSAQVASDEKLKGKPEKVLEGIVRGKLKKHYAEICLQDQIFQISNDEGLTVSQLLAKFNKDNGSDVKIVAYERFLAGA
ncbi:MAG: translation elongation factor Ts, partial [Spirochaetales bacterium]|nr:translation elongation factor Ts [Spirochaetales bacterium]